MSHVLALQDEDNDSLPLSWLAKNDGKVSANGEELKRLRKLAGLSQEALSQSTGLALKTIRNIENTQGYRCRLVTVRVLAQFFSTEPRALILAENGTGLQLLTNVQHIIEANIDIVQDAERILVCTGSRSRDENYLRTIETRLADVPSLIHYRLMAHPPFKKIFQDHLLRLLEIRDPSDRTQGYKTIHINLHDDLLKQPEFSLCASEKKALIVLPSAYGMYEYNTALLIEDPEVATRFAHIAKALSQTGKKLETAQDLLKVGLVDQGEFYE